MTITNRNLSRENVGPGRFRRAFATIARTAVLATGLALAVTTVKSPSDRPISFISEAKAAPARVRYSTSTDPLAMDRKLKAISAAVPSGTVQAKVSWIFNRLNQYASGGVKALNMKGKPPRTAAEALAKGGDCTDLASIVVAVFKKSKIPGGVMLVHFNSAPKNTDHLIPYALIGGKKIIVDLQTNALGKTAKGTYRKLMDMAYDEAAWMYHREMGDYFRNKGDQATALKAYVRSIQLNDKDPYVHQNVAVLYGRAGDPVTALKHIRKAASLDPAYKRYLPGAVYNAGLQQGQKAFQEGRYADCARHFESALNSGYKMPSAHRKALQRNVRVCRSNAARR